MTDAFDNPPLHPRGTIGPSLLSGTTRISLVHGDITRVDVDAVVTAANNGLRGGGGVDGAIHWAAGAELLQACRALGGCPTGEARITPGFRLPARYVIHAVGPIWRGGRKREPELLASAYRASLDLAVQHECGSIAFPAISCGVYGYPIDEACAIALDTIRQWCTHRTGLRDVLLVVFDPAVLEGYQRLF
jgi:O-acetyl-ADP-ribose deacetylase (regulator of RNase III)